MKDILPAVERAAVRGWPALITTRIDGWLCRLTSGGSVRANTVAALEYHGGDLAGSIDAVERFYAAHGASPIFTISEVSRPSGLDELLAERGYRRSGDHVTMAKPVSNPPPAMPQTARAADRADADWLPVYLSGLSPDRRGVAPRILAGLPPGRFISVLRAGRVVSSGLTIADGTLASVQCMATLPEARRCGAAGDVLAAIEHLAPAAGVSVLYLQTEQGNSAAVALYQRHGFGIIGRYHTRSR